MPEDTNVRQALSAALAELSTEIRATAETMGVLQEKVKLQVKNSTIGPNKTKVHGFAETMHDLALKQGRVKKSLHCLVEDRIELT